VPGIPPNLKKLLNCSLIFKLFWSYISENTNGYTLITIFLPVNKVEISLDNNFALEPEM
jgi:hypothetical protein